MPQSSRSRTLNTPAGRMQLTTHWMLKLHSAKPAYAQQQELKEPQETQSSFHTSTASQQSTTRNFFAHSLLLAMERFYSTLAEAQAGLGPTCTLGNFASFSAKGSCFNGLSELTYTRAGNLSPRQKNTSCVQQIQNFSLQQWTQDWFPRNEGCEI